MVIYWLWLSLYEKKMLHLEATPPILWTLRGCRPLLFTTYGRTLLTSFHDFNGELSLKVGPVDGNSPVNNHGLKLNKQTSMDFRILNRKPSLFIGSYSFGKPRCPGGASWEKATPVFQVLQTIANMSWRVQIGFIANVRKKVGSSFPSPCSENRETDREPTMLFSKKSRGTTIISDDAALMKNPGRPRSGTGPKAHDPPPGMTSRNQVPVGKSFFLKIINRRLFQEWYLVISGNIW